MSSEALDRRRTAVMTALQRLGIRPRRSEGQNFLLDSTVVNDLLEAAEIRATDVVLEIGPGLGAVTEALVRTAKTVIAVELDRRLAAYLDRRFSSEMKVTIVQGDVLRWRRDVSVTDGHYKLVSSLPFNITSIVLRQFLEQPPRPSLLSLIVQREVAERCTATPGSMSLLSVAVQYLGQPSLVRTIPRSSFWPQPEVDAAIIRINVRSLPPDDERKKVFRLARIGFSRRRKMLHNNLSDGLRIESTYLKEIFRRLDLHERCRAQDLGVDQWQKLAKILL